jgi:glycosyltransferase involved in cell wall biosynthesis
MTPAREREPTRVSVIICTHNRAPLLRKGLDSLRGQSLTCGDGIEILVVDNASTDETQDLVESFQSTTGNVRYIFESTLGLSHARNRGVREAHGELVAFIDDDAIAEPGWLDALVHAFHGVEPKPDCVGGRIEPIWQVPKPGWFPHSLLGYLSILDLGDEAHWCDIPREHLVGCNIAFRRNALLELGGFNTELGRKGQSLKGNEEIELLRRMKQRGQGVFYEPCAVVRHFIPRERLTKRWLVRRLYAEGLSDGVLRAFDSDEAGRWGWGRLWRAMQSVRVNLWKAMTAARPEERTLFQTRAAYSLGTVVCLLRCGLREPVAGGNAAAAPRP